MKRTRYTKGQSLVEMIVVVGMVVLLATGIVAGTTASLSRADTTNTRTQALSFAQAGIELARGARDTGWDAFALMGTPESIYCVGSDGLFGTPQTACATPNIDSTFIRAVTLSLTDLSGVETMQVTSTVTWGDTTNQSNAIELMTYFTQWR